MIVADDALAGIVKVGGVFRDYVVDVLVDGEPVILDHTLASCSLKSNGNAKIRTQGTAVFEYTDALGRTIVPEDLNSWITPYATFLNVYYRMSVGPFVAKILQGQLKVVGVTDPRDSRLRFGDRMISVGSRVGLQLADKFSVTARERFMAPTGPASLASTWAEIGRITGLPLNRNVLDAAIARDVTYDQGVLDATFALAVNLDGIPYVSEAGQVSIQPNLWGTETEELTVGPEGTINDVRPADLTDDEIYNQVVVRSHDDDQVRILAHAEVLSGPLRYGGPFGKVPYFASSQYITTEADALAYAQQLLPIVSSTAAQTYVIKALPDPRREVGDVVPFWHNDEQLVGRILERELADKGYMTLKVQVEA